MKLPSFPFVVLDTETTGLTPRVHRVIELAFVHVEKGMIVDEYEELFACGEELPPLIQAITRLHNDDLKGKAILSEQRSKIMERIPKDVLIIGQNISFDLSMLKGEGMDLSAHPWIDTSMLASLVFPEFESYSLSYMSEVLNLPHEPKHRALGDVHATLKLIERSFERMHEIPEDLLSLTREIMGRSSPGYRIFFEALPVGTVDRQPHWFASLKEIPEVPCTRFNSQLPTPPPGTVQLIEEPLDSSFLRRLIATLAEEEKSRCFVAVKNIEGTLRRLRLPTGARVLLPPFLLPDSHACERFAKQETYTADEATLATKLVWYEPRNRGEIPLHGGERDVWSGKIACVASSEDYLAQFDDLPGLVLIDHRQLLSFLIDPSHPAQELLRGSHIIIDDASMLEDTSTKAFGWVCILDHLRAAVQGDPHLTKLVDTIQLWLEKIRGSEDTHLLRKEEFQGREVRGLREQIEKVLESQKLTSQVRTMLLQLRNILQAENLQRNVVWMELRRDGGQELHSVPERIGELLRQRLFEKYAVTLLIPKGSASSLIEVLPKDLPMKLIDYASATKEQVASPPSITTPELAEQDILQHITEGKTVLLIPSRRRIEHLFTSNVERLEERGITLIAQGASGGQGRMQAEFLAAPPPAVLVATPWLYESIELPEGSADHLIIATLPFDSPSHPLVSRRGEHYRDSFTEYTLPRLEHRLFRILRAFSRHRTSKGDVRITDQRLQEKPYGARVRTYLQALSNGGTKALTNEGRSVAASSAGPTVQAKIVKKKARVKAPAPEEQMQLF